MTVANCSLLSLPSYDGECSQTLAWLLARDACRTVTPHLLARKGVGHMGV